MPTTLGISVSDGISTREMLGRMAGIRLDIGCGASKQAGWVGIDFQALPSVDIVHDLTVMPWPLPDECATVAMASHVVEHIAPHNMGFVKFMNEVWRVLKPGGEFAIVTPHGYSSGYLQDPTHCNPCNENTWLYFVQDHPFWGFYRPSPWTVKYLAWDTTANIEVVLVKAALHE
jgi:SAM-dependent methyltransferase